MNTAFRPARPAILYAALAAFTLLAAPAKAQSARLTDDDVIAGCGNELRAFDQDIIRIQKTAIADATQWKGLYIRANPNPDPRVIAQYQSTIDNAQATIDDLSVNGFQSTHSYLHWGGGNNMLDFYNRSTAAKIRAALASDREYAGGRRSGNPARVHR